MHFGLSDRWEFLPLSEATDSPRAQPVRAVQGDRERV